MNAHLLVALLLIFTVNQVSGFRSIRPSFLGRITPCTCLNVVSDIEIVAREFTLTDNLRQKVEEKIGKALEKLGQDATTARVVLRVHKAQMQEDHATKPESQIVEVTVGFKGGSAVHVEERSNDMYASVDVVSHRLTEHLRRHHDKLVNNKRGKKNSDGSILEEIVEEVVDEE